MRQSTISREFHPAEIVAAAFSLPLFSLFVALVILAVLLTILRIRQRRTGLGRGGATPSLPAQFLTERVVLGVGALTVIVAYAVENVVRGYLLNLVNIVEWWQYATPLFAAGVCLTVMLGFLSLRRGTSPGLPVVSLARRTWISFTSVPGLLGIAASSFALVATTVAAGMASSPDNRGRYILLAIPVPNVSMDALRPWFYGWAYGIPVLVCLAALIVVTWATLRRNSLRPFLSPETVVAEKRTRVQIATSVVRIATASTLLALGGAFRFIDRAGSMSGLEVSREGEPNDVRHDLAIRRVRGRSWMARTRTRGNCFRPPTPGRNPHPAQRSVPEGEWRRQRAATADGVRTMTVQAIVPAADDASPALGIYRQFRGLIVSGQLGAGERLPSVRQAASDLRVSPSTVAKAYKLLERDGLVVSRTAAGTRVAESAAVLPRSVMRRIRDLATEAESSGANADDVIDVLRVMWRIEPTTVPPSAPGTIKIG